MKLERAQHVARLFIVFAGGLDAVAVGRQRVLDVDQRQRFLEESLPVADDRLIVEPGAVSEFCESLPREARTRIDLAVGRNVGVADDVRRANVGMALENVAEQLGQQRELPVIEVGIKADALRVPGFGVLALIACMTPGLVDELDADRLVVDAVLAAPVADAGVPRPPVFVDELVDPELRFPVGRITGLRDQVMRADRSGGRFGEDVIRILEIGRRMVNDD